MPEVKVPELAESITEGTIAEWLKNVGDSVEKGEAILELETDKVNVEVVSEAGVLSEQLASEGDTVEVGQAIAVIGEGSGNASKENSNDNTPQQNEETNNKKKQQKILATQLKTIQLMTISSVLMLHLLRVDMLVKMV